MKANFRVLLLIILISISNVSIGQNLTQSRVANLVTGDYTTTGTVFLEAYDDNTLDLRFGADYLTQANVFDVHVFLTNNQDYTTPIDISNNLLVANIGTINGLNYSSGAMTFDLPAGVSINDYDHVVLVCIQFGQLHWAHGDFSIYTTPVLSEYIGGCEANPPTPQLTLANGTTITGASDTPFPITTLGTTSITWTFDDGAGNYTSTEQNVTVEDLNATIIQTNNLLSANPTSGSFQWIDCNNANAIIPGETNPTFTAVEPGNYAVIISAGSCQDTSSCQSITFQDIYTAPILNEVIDVCESTPPTPTLTLNNGTVIDGTSNTSFPITTVGSTTITWTFSDGTGNTLTSQQVITVNPLEVTVTSTGNSLEATSTGTDLIWVDCNNNYAPIPGETNSTFTPAAGGNYAVIATAGNCSDTSACHVVSIADIKDLSHTISVNLYPNPSNGDFIIDFDETLNEVNIIVTDLSGRTIFNQTYFSTKKIPMHVDGASTNYLITIQTAQHVSTFVHRIQ